MSTTSPLTDPNDFLMGGGGRTAKFTQPGDKIEGDILNLAVTQQTDMGGAPKFWSDGKPMEQLVVTLQTALSDDAEDDGVRRLYLKGSKNSPTSGLGATRAAVKAAGAERLEVGARLQFAYTSDGAPSSPGLNPPKQYAAKYTPPAPSSVKVDDIFGD